MGAVTVLTGLIKEFTPKFFEDARNMYAPLVAKGSPLPMEDAEGEEIVIMAMDPGLRSTQMVRDAGRRPTADRQRPYEGKALPATVTTTVGLGRLERLANMDRGKLSSMLDLNLTRAAEGGAKILDRGLVGVAVNPSAAAIFDGTGDGATADVKFEDVSMFLNIEGAAVDFKDASSAKSYRLRVGKTVMGEQGAFSANVAGTVTFYNDVGDPANNGATTALTDVDVATGDSFVLAGETAGFGGATTDTGDLISFDDIAGSGASSTLHSISPSDVASWTSRTAAADTVWTQELGLAFAATQQVYGGDYPDLIICNPQLIPAQATASGLHGVSYGQVAATSLQSSVHRNLDSNFDKYAGLEGGMGKRGGVTCGGIEMLATPSAPVSRAIFLSTKKTTLVKWTDIKPEEDGNGSPFHIDPTFVGVSLWVTGDLQLVSKNRRTVGIITGLQGF